MTIGINYRIFILFIWAIPILLVSVSVYFSGVIAYGGKILLITSFTGFIFNLAVSMYIKDAELFMIRNACIAYKVNMLALLVVLAILLYFRDDNVTGVTMPLLIFVTYCNVIVLFAKTISFTSKICSIEDPD